MKKDTSQCADQPQGGEWVLVPREPTLEMKCALMDYRNVDELDEMDDGIAQAIWNNTLAASPTPAVQTTKEKP